MTASARLQFRTLMFLQFFIWGAWYTTIAVYMRNHGMETLTHWPYTVNPVAAIVSPLFLGLIADRFFHAERVLGVLHLAGGITMLLIPQTTGSPGLFITLLLVYNLFYMPTLGLANALVFHHTPEREKEFPLIRVFGTVGWIVAGLFISFALVRLAGGALPEQTALPLYTAGVAGIALGLFSFTLPKTPPRGRDEPVSVRSVLGLDALARLGTPSFNVFLVSAFLICIPLAAYYNFTQIFLEAAGFRSIAAVQSLGQVSEVLFMVLMPFFFARLGVKWMLAIGMGAWVLRYLLFAIGAPESVVWMIMLGILLHGVCYDFLFVAGQIYVDQHASVKIRSQAQSLFVFVTYGVGMLVGAQIAGNVYNLFLGDAPVLTAQQFQAFWLLPALLSLAVLVFFVLAFRPPGRRRDASVRPETAG